MCTTEGEIDADEDYARGVAVRDMLQMRRGSVEDLRLPTGWRVRRQLCAVQGSVREGEDQDCTGPVRLQLGQCQGNCIPWRKNEVDLAVSGSAVWACGGVPVGDREGVHRLSRGLGVSGVEARNQGVGCGGETVNRDVPAKARGLLHDESAQCGRGGFCEPLCCSLAGQGVDPFGNDLSSWNVQAE